MGEVYRVREEYLMDRIVAIKVVRDTFAEDSQAIGRFKRELKLVGGLSHPNIVQAFGAEEIDGKILLIMEFIDGESLQHVVASGRKIPVDEALAIIRQVAVGLQYAHERRIVHRDIKPGNIMVTKDGVVKILDFGLGKFYGEMFLSGYKNSSAPLTKIGTPLGTLDFTPPEQCKDPGNVDIRADIYALGCTFYTIVVGEVPYPDSKFRGFYAKMDAQVRQPPPSFVTAGIEVAPAIEAILQKMCAKDHDQRFASPQELIDAIDANQRAFVPVDDGEKKHSFTQWRMVAGMVMACSLGLILLAIVFIGLPSTLNNSEETIDEWLPPASGDSVQENNLGEIGMGGAVRMGVTNSAESVAKDAFEEFWKRGKQYVGEFRHSIRIGDPPIDGNVIVVFGEHTADQVEGTITFVYQGIRITRPFTVSKVIEPMPIRCEITGSLLQPFGATGTINIAGVPDIHWNSIVFRDLILARRQFDILFTDSTLLPSEMRFFLYNAEGLNTTILLLTEPPLLGNPIGLPKESETNRGLRLIITDTYQPPESRSLPAAPELDVLNETDTRAY